MSGSFGKVNKKNLAEKFVFHLASFSSVIIDKDGAVIGQNVHQAGENLKPLSEGREVIVIVPAEDVFVSTINLPKMNATKLRHAIPYALEDQLIDDVDQLHFAFFPNANSKSEDAKTLVLIVAHDKMKSWLQTLQEFGLKAQRIIPASFALEAPLEHEIILWVSAQNILVSFGEHMRLACEDKNLGLYLSSMPHADKINIFNYTQTPLSVSEKFIAIETTLRPETYLSNLAKGVVKAQQINLLQGEYSVRTGNINALHQLSKAAAYFSIVWLALLIIYPLGSYCLLKSRASALQLQIEKIYKQQFPQSSSIVAPKVRMEEKLAQLKTQNGQDKFLMLLGELSRVMLNESHIKLQRLDFQNNQLNIRVIASSSDTISSFTDHLTQRGLAVKQQNASVSGADTHAALQIE